MSSGVDETITLAEVEAVIRELLSAEEPPSSACLRLPSSKEQSPKLVCLDMKDWIELSSRSLWQEVCPRFGRGVTRTRGLCRRKSRCGSTHVCERG